MAGEWILEKAKGLMHLFPGAWEALGEDVYQGRCPGEHLHTKQNAKADCRVHLRYGDAGQTPGIYCFHSSCRGVLDGLNETFRTALFARGPDYVPTGAANDGVVRRAPQQREGWIPEFSMGKLRSVVAGVPEVTPEWFMERSPQDVSKIGPGDFLEHVFLPGERVILFTEYKGPGDYLWEVGRGGYRLSQQRGVAAVKSALPNDGGKDGVWFLANPVDGKWYPNPRREGKYSRRSMESVTSWRFLVLECDEEKTLRVQARALRAAAKVCVPGVEKEVVMAELMEAKREKWAERMIAAPSAFLEQAKLHDQWAMEVPGLWLKLLAMSPLSIRAIYSSGGHSLHALVAVDQASKADFDTLLRQVAKKTLPLLGADPAAMTPVRLTRLPGCTRGGKEQRLIYLNPKAAGVPIRDMPRCRVIGTSG